MYICIVRIHKKTPNSKQTDRNWSDPKAGLRRLSGSEFQTVGPAEAKEQQPKVLQRTRGIVS